MSTINSSKNDALLNSVALGLTGAVVGGAGGYIFKNPIKGSELSDDFVRTVAKCFDKSTVDNLAKEMPFVPSGEELTAIIETDAIDMKTKSLPEIRKFYLKALKKAKADTDEIKKAITSGKTYDEIKKVFDIEADKIELKTLREIFSKSIKDGKVVIGESNEIIGKIIQKNVQKIKLKTAGIYALLGAATLGAIEYLTTKK